MKLVIICFVISVSDLELLHSDDLSNQTNLQIIKTSCICMLI